jgi:sensor domain CHASE-containing protein
MSKRYSNVIVHVSGEVDPVEHAGIEQAIAAERGVRRAERSRAAERFILVDYDPFAISAQRILETVRGPGVGAHLIGM